MTERLPNDVITERLNGWLTNPPDYWEVAEVYDSLGTYKKELRLLQRKINALEDQITANADKPRSNDTKKEKLAATAELADRLAYVESEIVFLEMRAKKLEYIRSMFSSASYVMKSRTDLY